MSVESMSLTFGLISSFKFVAAFRSLSYLALASGVASVYKGDALNASLESTNSFKVPIESFNCEPLFKTSSTLGLFEPSIVFKLAFLIAWANSSFWVWFKFG